AASTKAEHDAIREELGTSAGDVQGRLAELEGKAAERIGKRAELAKVLPPVLYRRYEMIRTRRGRAICHTTEGTCSGCHMALPPMMFQVLRRELKLDQCPHCNRIIYFKVTPDEADETEGAADNAAGNAPAT